ncbi:hypothetical protein TWF694_005841 [Orbilia ellipsospora]|uniref:Mid2 domain-containing protein n=1 Tax=Orbilia ellipsospora TaxID=2528407 RepID=A0AAV9WT56_9PEZI
MRAAPFVFLFGILLGFLFGTTRGQDTATDGINSPVQPNSTTDVVAGRIYPLEWFNVAGDRVSLALIHVDDNTPRTSWPLAVAIANDIPNRGSYNWSVPYAIYSFSPSSILSALKITVTEGSHLGEVSYSDDFFLQQKESFAGSALSFTSPVGSSTPATSSTPPPTSSSSSSSLPPLTTPPSDSGNSNPNSRQSSQDSPPASSTSSTTSNSSSGSPSSKSGSNNTGIIAGSVIGGIAVVVIGGLAGYWLISRERRMRGAEGSKPTAQPDMRPDPNNQSIWNGNEAYSYNPNKDARDVTGGMAMPG